MAVTFHETLCKSGKEYRQKCVQIFHSSDWTGRFRQLKYSQIVEWLPWRQTRRSFFFLHLDSAVDGPRLPQKGWHYRWKWNEILNIDSLDARDGIGGSSLLLFSSRNDRPGILHWSRLVDWNRIKYFPRFGNGSLSIENEPEGQSNRSLAQLFQSQIAFLR